MLHQTIITLLSIVVVWQLIGLITAIVERRMTRCPHCERKDALVPTAGAGLDYPLGPALVAEFRCRYCDYRFPNGRE